MLIIYLKLNTKKRNNELYHSNFIYQGYLIFLMALPENHICSILLHVIVNVKIIFTRSIK